MYGVRSKRKKDTFFKRFTAQSFYKVMNKMGADVIYNHADYRLVSNKVLKEFSSFKEVNLFLRGMFPLVGFKSTIVYYERNERLAGKSHYPLKKMIGLAIDGITSLSIKPLQLIFKFGMFLFLLSILGIATLIVLFILLIDFPSWLITLCIVSTSTSINLIALGVVGEYVGKNYMEVKQRPRYIISEKTNDKQD